MDGLTYEEAIGLPRIYNHPSRCGAPHSFNIECKCVREIGDIGFFACGKYKEVAIAINIAPSGSSSQWMVVEGQCPHAAKAKNF